MLSFFEWFETERINPDRPWVIFGKGPSFSKRSQYDLSGFYTLSLNHALREQPVTVAHMIDYDVVDGCGDSIFRNAQFLVLPWIPHVNNDPGSKNLEELTRVNSILRRMDEEGRLLWYNLSTARERYANSPVVRARFFSAEAALNLLATAGVRKVRSLGVDGGASYSQEFDDLKGKTLLANTRESFDIQFQEIARSILTTGIDYAPLDVESPIRVYVGCTEAQMLAAKVLEYSIRMHASMSVEVFPLHLCGIEIPTPRDPARRPRTPFSFQRFLIPGLAGYRGRAIYLDSDMLVFRDIRSLWSMPFDEADLLTVREPETSRRRPQFSVMLLNCELLRWNIEEIVRSLDEGSMTYEELMYEMPVARNIRADISSAWNSLEQFEAGNTALLHYTDMPTQPWVSRTNPLGYLWMGNLFEAIDSGFISLDFLTEQVMKGHVRPSLVHQLWRRTADSRKLPLLARFLDSDFVAPFQSNHRQDLEPRRSRSRLLRAALLDHYQKRASFRLLRNKSKRSKRYSDSEALIKGATTADA